MMGFHASCRPTTLVMQPESNEINKPEPDVHIQSIILTTHSIHRITNLGAR